MKISSIVIGGLVVFSQTISAGTISGRIVDGANIKIPGIQADAYMLNNSSGGFEYKASGKSDSTNGDFSIPELPGGSYMLVANPGANVNSANLFSNAWDKNATFWNLANNKNAGYKSVNFGLSGTSINLISVLPIPSPPATDPETKIGNIQLTSTNVCSIIEPLKVFDSTTGFRPTDAAKDYSFFCPGGKTCEDQDTKAVISNPKPKVTDAGAAGAKLQLAYTLTNMPANVWAQPLLFVTNRDDASIGLNTQMVISLPAIDVATLIPPNERQTILIPARVWDNTIPNGENWVLNVGIQFLEYESGKPKRSICSPILFPVER